MRKIGSKLQLKNIGIILNSTDCNRYIYETIQTLASQDNIKLFFLLQKSDDTLNKPIEMAVYKLLIDIEYNIVSRLVPRFAKEIKKHREVFSIKEFTKHGSSNLVYSIQDDLEAIKLLNLDLIFKADDSQFLKDEIFTLAKDGIISIEYSDTRWNRSGVTAFWEVYLRKSSIGFTIQKLSHKLQNSVTLFKGEIAISRLLGENIIDLYKESNPYVAKIFIDYAEQGILPRPERKIPFAGPMLTTPSLLQSVHYVLKTIWLFLKLFVNKKIFKNESRLSVAFVPTNWEDANLQQSIEIKTPENRFFADPFIITREGRSICYVEDFSYDKQLACITAIEIFEDNSYEILEPVIEESFHMSFPFLLEFEGSLYMIPETSQSNSIRLYKCINFPLKWEYQQDIMDNCSAADTMIFKHEQKWWLFTNMATKNNSDQAAQLFAYYSDHPFSNSWTPHSLNPLVFNSNFGRNAGLLPVKNSLPVRARQKQDFNMYGASFSLAEISQLTPSTYQEKEICQILPNFLPKIKGCHHIHSNNHFTVFDFMRNETPN
ncbi:MAG TPA: hypothetical protein EYH11_00460 [Sulfurimonas autotrophica]|nr:hypothetical protein [Sulfurimonas autotrophica]